LEENSRMSEISGRGFTKGRKHDLRASKMGLDAKINVYTTAVQAFAARVAWTSNPFDVASVISSYNLRRRSVDATGQATRVSFAPVVSGDLRPVALDQSRFGDISSCEASLKWACAYARSTLACSEM
jgi:hypothetical protein